MAQNGTEYTRRRYPMAANAVIEGNDTVCIITGGGASSGYAVAGQASTTLRAKGIAQAFYDKSGALINPQSSGGDNTGGADGDMFVEVAISFGKMGIRTFKRNNDTGGGALTQADVGSKIYVKDNVTVTKTSGGNSPAGELDRIDANGYPWVIFPLSY